MSYVMKLFRCMVKGKLNDLKWSIWVGQNRGQYIPSALFVSKNNIEEFDSLQIATAIWQSNMVHVRYSTEWHKLDWVTQRSHCPTVILSPSTLLCCKLRSGPRSRFMLNRHWSGASWGWGRWALWVGVKCLTFFVPQTPFTPRFEATRLDHTYTVDLQPRQAE